MGDPPPLSRLTFDEYKCSPKAAGANYTIQTDWSLPCERRKVRELRYRGFLLLDCENCGEMVCAAHVPLAEKAIVNTPNPPKCQRCEKRNEDVAPRYSHKAGKVLVVCGKCSR